MGLLDDAIRQHLDLKRRRGADPSEVERAEREALGPVRRVQAPESAEADEVSDQVSLADEDGFDHEAEPALGVAFDHEADEESWSFEDDEPASAAQSDHGLEAPLEAEALGQETAVHRPDFLDDDGFDEPDFESPRRDTPPPHPARGETEEYDVEHALGSHPAGADAEDGEGEELLEETPEFLQDTPDHDRLWFEQRPPKDFDFDG
ncbi:MAG: hypothetical protein QOF83_1945 [Solirubrobacteraceae bacterium]|jgi:hypothetical protein|nr:hypothetical protein [Solirubrobacteraceae bacterium]